MSFKSNACSCAGSESIKEAYSESDIVFIGTVVSIKKVKANSDSLVNALGIFYQNEVTVATNTSFKGTPSSLQTIITGIGHGDCGFRFQEGEQYIIYATSKGVYSEIKQSNFQTNICDRTNTIDELSEDIAQLNELANRTPQKLK